jgi:hypothetical protein
MSCAIYGAVERRLEIGHLGRWRERGYDLGLVASR